MSKVYFDCSCVHGGEIELKAEIDANFGEGGKVCACKCVNCGEVYTVELNMDFGNKYNMPTDKVDAF